MQTAGPLLDILSGEREQGIQPANSSFPTRMRGESLIFRAFLACSRIGGRQRPPKPVALPWPPCWDEMCMHACAPQSPCWDGLCMHVCAHAYIRGVCWDGLCMHVCAHAYIRGVCWDGLCMHVCAHAYVRGVCWDGVCVHMHV